MESPFVILFHISLSLAYLLLCFRRLSAVPLSRRIPGQGWRLSAPVSIIPKSSNRTSPLLLALGFGFLLGASAAWSWVFFYPHLRKCTVEPVIGIIEASLLAEILGVRQFSCAACGLRQ